jgi:hypothetical protein
MVAHADGGTALDDGRTKPGRLDGTKASFISSDDLGGVAEGASDAHVFGQRAAEGWPPGAADP